MTAGVLSQPFQWEQARLPLKWRGINYIHPTTGKDTTSTLYRPSMPTGPRGKNKWMNTPWLCSLGGGTFWGNSSLLIVIETAACTYTYMNSILLNFLSAARHGGNSCGILSPFLHPSNVVPYIIWYYCILFKNKISYCFTRWSVSIFSPLCVYLIYWTSYLSCPNHLYKPINPMYFASGWINKTPA